MGFLRLTGVDTPSHSFVNMDCVTLIYRVVKGDPRHDGTDAEFTRIEFDRSVDFVLVHETPEEILTLLAAQRLVIENLFDTVRDVLAAQKILDTTEEEQLDLAIVIADTIRHAALTGGA